MDDEIVRKLVDRTSCSSDHRMIPLNYNLNKNSPLLKNGFGDPLMHSTPVNSKRKPSVDQMFTKKKHKFIRSFSDSGLRTNITPSENGNKREMTINNKKYVKQSSYHPKCSSSCIVSCKLSTKYKESVECSCTAFKTQNTSSHKDSIDSGIKSSSSTSSTDWFDSDFATSKCKKNQDPFDEDDSKILRPTQNQFLSEDDSVFDAVDLESAVKGYLKSNSNNSNSESNLLVIKEQCRSPSFLQENKDESIGQSQRSSRLPDLPLKDCLDSLSNNSDSRLKILEPEEQGGTPKFPQESDIESSRECQRSSRLHHISRKDYLGSDSCNSNSTRMGLEPEDQGGSPLFPQKSEEESNNHCSRDLMLNKVDCESNDAAQENVNAENILNQISVHDNEHVIDDDLQNIVHNWNNNSLLSYVTTEEDFIDNENITPARVASPLGEKIRKALITNVHKPVVHMSKEVALSEHSNTNMETKYIVKLDKPFFDVGPFFGLPSKVKHLIQKVKGIDDLYAWQKECLSLDAIQKKKNLIYSLPTSGGKTLVAEILMLRELMCYKKDAIFVLPYVSIVQEKVRSLAPFGLDFDFFVEEYAAGKGQYPPKKRRKKQSVFLATIEKAMGIVNSLIELNRLDEIGLVIVDEIHLVGDTNGRGATLESLLTKLLFFQGKVQIIGMSATIGNVHEVATFLDAELYTQNFRPVELKEYVKCEDKLYSINYNPDSLDNLLVLERKLSFQYPAPIIALDPDKVGGLVAEVIPENSCLVFCPSKKNCENVAILICKSLPRNVLEHKHAEKRALYEALKSEGNGSVCSVLRKTLPFGLAYHHSGLTGDERRLIEEAYQMGTLCCLCCTSTLAAGVNLPAKRVILRAPYIGRDFINLSRYKQMVGRAGRAGFGEVGESILMCKRNETKKVGELLSSKMDEVISALHLNEGVGLQSLILSAVGLGMATTIKSLRALTMCSLLSVQASRLEINITSIVQDIIVELIKLKAVKVKVKEENTTSPKENSFLCNISNVSLTDLDTSDEGSRCSRNKKKEAPKIRALSINTELEVSRLGKAAIKGCIPLSRAHMLYKDLLQAQASLVLLSCLHLLYLVTPYDLVSQVKPCNTVYFSLYNKLNANDLKTAQVIGITETVMARLINGLTVKSVPEQVLNRFYMTMILYDLWNKKSVWDVANEFQVPRGFVQTLMTSSAAFAASVLRFCEEITEFWAFKDLLLNFSQQLSHCCTAELIPLMDLPAVKRGRARQLYKAGYKTLQHVANADASEMVNAIDHMPKRVATQIIAAAKMLLKQKAESLREEAEELLEGLNS